MWLESLLITVRLGMANDDLSGIYPDWQVINKRGAEVQAHVSDKH